MNVPAASSARAADQPPAGRARPACAGPPARHPIRASAAELRARFERHGAAVLGDAELLELLGVAPAAAAAMLNAFGSLPEALGAACADLRRVAGSSTAIRVKAVQALACRLLQRPLRERPLLGSSSQVADYLRASLVGYPREQFRVLFLDKKNRLISDEAMSEGTVDHAPVYPREVVRRALELHASALVLAHNHPSGDPAPSAADADMTRKVVEAARALGIAVHDHIVVGGQATASLKALGLM